MKKENTDFLGNLNCTTTNSPYIIFWSDDRVGYDSQIRHEEVERGAWHTLEGIFIRAVFNKKRGSNVLVQTMRRLVDTVVQREHIKFQNMIEQVSAHGYDVLSNTGTAMKIGDEILVDEVNWECIIAFYAFVFYWFKEVKRLSKKKYCDIWAISHVDALTRYVRERFGQWILENGGWVSHTLLSLYKRLLYILTI